MRKKGHNIEDNDEEMDESVKQNQTTVEDL